MGIWAGSSNLVVALDIGVGDSRVSFAVLENGVSIVVHRVIRWPGQGLITHSKLLTAVLYDDDQQMVAAGREALLHKESKVAEAKRWTLIQDFPLHLYPASERSHLAKPQPLPAGLSLATIYSDFMSYLLQHTRSYISHDILDGDAIVKRYWKGMTAVLVVPSAWSVKQQHLLRKAFLRTDPNFAGSIQFVERGEAQMYRLEERFGSTMTGSLLHKQSGPNTLICDIHDTWVGLSVYQQAPESSFPRFVRINGTVIQTGPSVIKHSFEQHLRHVFINSDIPAGEKMKFIEAGVKDFEAHALREFDSTRTNYYIQFADTNFSDSKLNIQRGRMLLTRDTLKISFDLGVSKIITEIQRYVSAFERDSELRIQTIAPIGNFAANQYFRESLSLALDGTCCKLWHDNSSEKSRFNSDGAVLSEIYRQRLFPAILHRSIGIVVGERYSETNSSHQGRRVYRGHGGFDIVANKWAEIIKLGDMMGTRCSVRRKLCRSLKPSRKTTPGIDKFSCDIWSFTGSPGGKIINTGWVKDTAGHINPGFSKLGCVEAHLDSWKGSLVKKYVATKPKDAIELFLVIEFDGGNFCAHIEWEEDGITRRGSSSIRILA
ncbi:hypothetical protein CTheo_3027 [Ceratobasidium theobromae]|uniref:Heat shock protein HSP70 n=1 Tax=Ceratobasidium theobromae TaxID=1582974 RepID=A0A5N5QPU5_9AGAM|nr:hypothetical protein CTheo_3027 [Ceratobasidium theobromae]